MPTVRSITTRYLNSKASLNTRARYKKDIIAWQKWCVIAKHHVLDASANNCQKYADHLSENHTPMSVCSRMSGLSGWFEACIEGGIIKANGVKSVKLPKIVVDCETGIVPTEQQIFDIVKEVANLGPRWEWLVSMIAWCGTDVSEALRVKHYDVRTNDGKTVIRLFNRRGGSREVPVDGRLEVLTLGLVAVFKSTVSIGGSVTPQYAAQKINILAKKATGEPITVQSMRRTAVKRQFDRGVGVAVIAKWLGHTTDYWVRRTLQITNDVALVTRETVIDSIIVEPNGDRYGSGKPADSNVNDKFYNASGDWWRLNGENV